MKKLLLFLTGVLGFVALTLPFTLEMISPTMAARAACGSSLCVQMKDNENVGQDADVTVALDSNATAGNLLVVSLFFCDNPACNGAAAAGFTITVADTLTNSYTLAKRLDSSSWTKAIYYVCSSGSGANTVTVTTDGSGAGGLTANYLWASVVEFSGIADASCLDQVGDDSGTGTTSTISTDGATTQATELVYAVGQGHTDQAAGSTALNAFSTGAVQDQYKTVSATGTQNLVWTMTSADWSGVIATFKETGGAATPRRGTLIGVLP
jgi:hypothetical protein